MYLSKKAEPRLKETVEERELGIRDIALLVAMIAVLVSVITFIPFIIPDTSAVLTTANTSVKTHG